jgi:hypothetical protein
MLHIIERKCTVNTKESTDELKNGLQMDDLVNHFFEGDHLMDGWTKFTHNIEILMVPHKTVYEYM